MFHGCASIRLTPSRTGSPDSVEDQTAAINPLRLPLRDCRSSVSPCIRRWFPVQCPGKSRFRSGRPTAHSWVMNEIRCSVCPQTRSFLVPIRANRTERAFSRGSLTSVFYGSGQVASRDFRENFIDRTLVEETMADLFSGSVPARNQNSHKIRR